MSAKSSSRVATWMCISLTVCLVGCCLIMVGGCEPSTQLGEFTANGTFSLKTSLGRYVEVNGTKAGSSVREPLLRILTVFTNEPLQDDLIEAHGQFESVIEFTGKDHHLEVNWDRQKDTISTGGSSWNRTEANLILCVFDGESWSAFGGNIAPKERSAEAVEDAIRGQFSSQIPYVNSLKLAEAKFPEL